jgi:hypothetical protein
MFEIRRANQTIEAHVCLGREMMKHQRASAQTVRSNFKGRPIRREWIEPAVPRHFRILRDGIQQIVLAIVEDEFETPVGRQGQLCRASEIRKVRRAVTVKDVLKITVRRAGSIGAISLINLTEVNRR